MQRQGRLIIVDSILRAGDRSSTKRSWLSKLRVTRPARSPCERCTITTHSRQVQSSANLDTDRIGQLLSADEGS